MTLENELFRFAGLSDRMAATIASPVSNLVNAPVEEILEFLDSANAGAQLDPLVLREVLGVLTRNTLLTTDKIEEGTNTGLVTAAQMTATHVRDGLDDEELDQDNDEVERKQGVNKLALLLGTSAGATVFRDIVNKPFPAPGTDNARRWGLWMAGVATDLAGQTRRVLQEGQGEGKALKEIVREIRGFQKKAEQMAFSTSRNAITDVSNRVLMSTYLTSNVVVAVRYVATLDNKTSEICQGLSGKVWPIGSSDIAFPPRHPNCRSILMPILRGQENAPAPPDYETWLKQRPVSEQRSILGPSKFRAFKAGLGLSQMASRDSAFSVEQLKRLYPTLFAEAS